MRKRILSVAAAFFLSMVAAGQCRAQQGITLQVTVPFAFEAGNKAMPAGDYTVRTTSFTGESIQQIALAHGKMSVMVGTMPVERNNKPVSARLVFHKYGNDYFLAEIWSGETQGRHLYKSSREKEVAATAGPEQVAVLAHAPAEGQ